MPNKPINHPERPADILAGKALEGLQKNYLVIGKQEVRSWKAWLIIGVVAGISLGIMFVANRSARFETGKAWYDDFYDFVTFDEEYYSYSPQYSYEPEPALSSSEFSSLTTENSEAIQELQQTLPLSEFSPSYGAYVEQSCPTIRRDDALEKPDTQTEPQLVQVLSEAEQDITSTATLYSQGSSSQRSTLDYELDQIAYYRKPILMELIREDPDTALEYIIDQQQYQSGPSLPSNCVEQKTTIEGELQILHADYFEEGYSVNQYTVRTPQGEEIELHPAQSTEDLIISGQNVQVTGYRLDNDFIYDGTDENSVIVPDYQPYFGSTSQREESRSFAKHVIKEAEAHHNPVHTQIQQDARGEQKTVVLLVKFGAESDPSVTRASINNMMFTEIKNFYIENSYGKITTISGDIFPASGWYSLPISTCYLDSLLQDAITASDRDVNFSQYSRVVIVAPTLFCERDGGATVGRRNVRTNDGTVSLSAFWSREVNLYVYAHEFGHNLGLGHANFIHCLSPDRSRGLAISPVVSDCQHIEYGDRFDIMGVGALFHTNALHKEYLGWLDASNIQTVTAGTYEIGPIETATSSLKVIKIPRSTNNTFLYIEYRQPIGFDLSPHGSRIPSSSFEIEGALMHTQGLGDSSYILDMSPIIHLNDTDPALLVGNSFTDYASGSTISSMRRTQGVNGILTVEVRSSTMDFDSRSLRIIPAHPTVGEPLSLTGAITSKGVGSIEYDTSARLRIDTNNDGAWDSGNFETKTIGPLASGASQNATWDLSVERSWFWLANTTSLGSAVTSWVPIGTVPQTAERLAFGVWALKPFPPSESSIPLSGDRENYRITFNNGTCYRTDEPATGFVEGGCAVISNLSSDVLFEDGYEIPGGLMPSARECDFRYTASTRLIEFRDESSNTSCGFAVFTYRLTWTPIIGTHRFEVCADSANIIGESDETNNCATKTFTIVKPVATQSAAQEKPAVSGDRIVWQDSRNDEGDIYLYNLATNAEQRLSGAGLQDSPDISGSKVVWRDAQNNGDIHLYDVAAATSSAVVVNPSSQRRPKISGNYIVWEDERNVNDDANRFLYGVNKDIYLYDISLGREILVAGGPPQQYMPSIHENRIVWIEKNPIAEVYSCVYNSATGECPAERITSNTSVEGFPQVFQNSIVWLGEEGGDWYRYHYDITTRTTRRLTDTPTLSQAPLSISGNFIAWEDQIPASSNPDIYVHNLATNTRERIVDHQASQKNPDVDGNILVWQDDRNGNWDIYMTNFSP